MRWIASACVLALCASLAYADLTVVPNQYANTVGQGGLNTITRNAANPRSYQVIYDKSQLAAIPVGYDIIGLTWRMYTGYAPWPPAGGASWTNWDVRISTPKTTVGTFSLNFADNEGANVVMTKSGPLTIAEGYFPGPGGPPNPFPVASIMFATPFKYPGGDLLIDIRHPGGLHASATGYLDGVTSAGPGYGTLTKGMSATTYTPVAGTLTTAYITRIEYVPEPASLALLAIGAALLRRR